MAFANIIEVEVDVSGIKTNEDHSHTVGLPDAAVCEPCETAVSTFPPPTSPLISRPRTSAKRVLDLTRPRLWRWWALTEDMNKKKVADCLFVELSLDGGVRGVRGALPTAVEAGGKKIPRLIVPELNAREAAMRSRRLSRALPARCHPLREYRQWGFSR
jgi:magnesium chelatase family protein